MVEVPRTDPWEFERWAADARARDAADSRVRERWLRQQARDEATLAGILIGHAERGAVLVVATTGGRRHRGTVAGVGDDFVALRPATGHVVLVPMAAVGEIRVAGGETAKPGEPAGRAGGGAAQEVGRARTAGEDRGDRGDRGDGGDGAAQEGRSGIGLAVTLADLLSQAAGHRTRLALHAGDLSVVGDLESVGADVLTLALDGAPPGVAYVRLASVSDISLFASG